MAFVKTLMALIKALMAHTKTLMAPVCLLVALAVQAQAQDITPLPAEGYVRAFPNILEYEDKRRALTIDDAVEAFEDGLFHAPTHANASFSSLAGVVWIRFVVSNRDAVPRSVVFEYVDHSLNYFNAYLQQAATGEIQSLGDQSIYASQRGRPLSHFRFAVPAQIPARSQSVVYLRLEHDEAGAGPVFADARIWEATAFNRAQNLEKLLLGIFNGLVVAMAILSLALFVIARLRAALYYSFYLFASLYGWGTVSGLWGQFLFSEAYHPYHFITATGVLALTAAQFSRAFINTATHTPVVDRLILAWMAVAAVCTVGGLTRTLHSALFVEIIFLGWPLLLVAGLRRYWQGEPLALAFTLGWLLQIVGLFSFGLRETGVIDQTLFTYWLGSLGVLVELLIFSVLLALRVADIRRDQQAAENRALQLLRDHKQQLEQEVAQRTLELRTAKEKAEQEARIDLLTGIANRRAFLENTSRALAQAARRQAPAALVIIDIDHFKFLNDRYGHEVGDKVLAAFARAVKSQLRQMDVFGRIGGEEFALLLPDTDAQGAALACDRLRAAIGAIDIGVLGIEERVTASFGVQVSRAGTDYDTMARQADKALYRAKASGRDQIIIHGDQVPVG